MTNSILIWMKYSYLPTG